MLVILVVIVKINVFCNLALISKHGRDNIEVGIGVYLTASKKSLLQEPFLFCDHLYVESSHAEFCF